ncbi:helix-turn-helix domain-containing protein [Streptomyces radicis]|uniref:XRE family transcriptional regulator n=1 Tax=Streptomyces radicis TaxID=1750517 RepID=A0A3A9WUV7_9ACTN|nr:helix-turn-helix transcriptional regulator [Streptomyces radicis]RKN11586.1 XRE family transcriptional regulator [Streptomyces radicis]RKN26395.1 XRE family transcriptional regulator [Streptomyces radicis]
MSDPLPDWLRAERLEIGRRIRTVLEHADLTQERLAERLGVDRMTLVRIELAVTSPRVVRLLHIARALGIPPARLTGRAGR